MNFGQFSAALIDYNKVRIVLTNEKYREENVSILIKNNKGEIINYEITDTLFQFRTNIFELKLQEDLVFGTEYVVTLANFGSVVLNVNNAPQFHDFDNRFFYEGPLGAIYSKKQTSFNIWAPLASRVILCLRKTISEEPRYISLKREENGLFSTIVEGDLEKYIYQYLITNSGYETLANDPYAFSSLANNKASVVVNFDAFKVDFFEEKTPKFMSSTQMIIYETSVRDMTVDARTDVKHKATFYGLIEEGRKTKQGYPVGFDYIKKLGINTLQLLPIYDFVTVDEENPLTSYNWGYDPGQYFVPEGSYARDVSDPYSRILDLMLLVSKYHSIGVAISMDVVFNHVYEHQDHTLEKVVPNYYFRKDGSGRISNGSGCGNDVASERKMVSRMIVDAAVHFIKYYHIDAFRFDLVGLIDQKTIKKIHQEVIKIKPTFQMYGEGWNMLTALDSTLLANMNNAFKTPYIGYFNDAFREIVKGGSFANNITDKGYILGETSFRDGFKFAFKGSVTNSTFVPKFIDARQSINFVECHDNGTFIDKLIAIYGEEDYQQHLRILQAANTVVMLSHGVPFFHRGQEIGLSKYGDMNSYRSSDKVNQFAYTLAYKRAGLVDYFADLVKLRKECKFLHEYDPKKIEANLEFVDLPSGGLIIKFKNVEVSSPYQIFNIYVNISKDNLSIDFEQPLKVILNQSGYVQAKSQEFVQHSLIPKQSVLIMGLRKERVEK